METQRQTKADRQTGTHANQTSHGRQKTTPTHLVELLVLLLVLRQLVEELDGLLDEVLADHLEDLVLL